MKSALSWIALAVIAAATTGCATLGGGQEKQGTAPATTGSSASPKKVAPGMNENGEVVDSSRVEAGQGQKVKGIDNWEGEITGKPAPGSKFGKLQIGMGMKQVTELAGAPTDQGAYITGKAWIPFYFGSDRHRYEMVFKGQGRLIFAGGSLGDFSNGNLIWIIHNARESGYR